MPILDLDDRELQQITDHIANTMVWIRAQPLLLKIGQQIAAQQQGTKMQSMAGRVGGDGSQPIADNPN